MNNTKAYIGDGVYLDDDGFGFILTTEDGTRVTNKIYLEPDVWQTLVDSIKKRGE